MDMMAGSTLHEAYNNTPKDDNAGNQALVCTLAILLNNTSLRVAVEPAVCQGTPPRERHPFAAQTYLVVTDVGVGARVDLGEVSWEELEAVQQVGVRHVVLQGGTALGSDPSDAALAASAEKDTVAKGKTNRKNKINRQNRINWQAVKVTIERGTHACSV